MQSMLPTLCPLARTYQKDLVKGIDAFTLKRRQRDVVAPLPGQYLRISQRADAHAARALAVHFKEIAPHMRQLVRHRGDIKLWRRPAGLLLHSLQMPLERLAVLLSGAELERTLGKLQQLAL